MTAKYQSKKSFSDHVETALGDAISSYEDEHGFAIVQVVEKVIGRVRQDEFSGDTLPEAACRIVCNDVVDQLPDAEATYRFVCNDVQWEMAIKTKPAR